MKVCLCFVFFVFWKSLGHGIEISNLCSVSIVSIVRGADCAAAVTAACCCSQLLHADQTPPPSPPAAALQDRKTRAAENQHQRRGTGDWCGYTLCSCRLHAAPALQIWVAVWALAGRGAPAAAESGPGIPQGEDTPASSHRPPRSRLCIAPILFIKQ